MLLLLVVLACARHPTASTPTPATPTPEGCQAGDLALCRRLAAQSVSLHTGRALDRWACDRGHAPSCRALADAETGADRTRDLAAACARGDLDACTLGSMLPDDAKQILAIGAMALAACGNARSAPACARAESLGWRGPEVRDVRIVEETYTVHALLPGGTPIVWHDELHAWLSSGPLDLPTPARPGTVDPARIRHLRLTPDGHLLAQATQPLLVWDAMTGVVTRLDVWPPEADSNVQAFAVDGSALAARHEGYGVLTWRLPGGELVGTVPDPGKARLAGVAVGPRGDRLALVEMEGWAGAEPARSSTTEPRSGPWEGWLADVDLPVGTPDRASISPDGRLIAVAEAEGVSLSRPDGVEVGRIRLGPVLDRRVLHAPLWSPDGGRLLVGLGGKSAVIATSTATSSESEDRALLARIQPLPALPEAPPPTFVRTVDARGTVSVAGVPVRGATVRAEPCVPGPDARNTRTRADGTFSIAAMADGCWTFTASGAGGLPADSESVRVGKEDAHLELIATHAVTGVVLGADGRPATGVTVRARLQDKQLPNGVRGRLHVVVSEAVTGPDGTFTLAQAPVERFTVEALRGGEAVSAVWATRAPPPELRLKPALIVETDEDPNCNHTEVFVERADGQIVEGTFEAGSWIGTDFTPGETLRLHIRELHTDGPTVTVTLPLDGPVRLESMPWGRLRVHAVPGAKVWLENGIDCVVRGGECLTQWRPVDRYWVGVHAPDHRVGIVEVQMRAGEVIDVDVPLTFPTTTIAGRIVDPQGTPIAGVELRMTCGRFETSAATTGPDGRFRLEGIIATAALAPFGHVFPRTLHVGGDGSVPLERALTIPETGAAMDLGDVSLPPR